MRILDDDEIGRLASAGGGLVHRVPSGFPSPAADASEPTLDVRSLLVKRPAATFFVEMKGESMCASGIYPSDILVVDRSMDPWYSCVVVAAYGGELVVRHYAPDAQGIWLLAGSEEFAPLWLGDAEQGTRQCVWGVVTFAIHPLATASPFA